MVGEVTADAGIQDPDPTLSRSAQAKVKQIGWEVVLGQLAKRGVGLRVMYAARLHFDLSLLTVLRIAVSALIPARPTSFPKTSLHNWYVLWGLARTICSQSAIIAQSRTILAQILR